MNSETNTKLGADLTRREILDRAIRATTALALTPMLPACADQAAQATTVPGAAELSNAGPTADMPMLHMAMLLYPGFTMLDLTGPQAALGRVAQTYLVSASDEPVLSDSGIALAPNTSYDDCPEKLDVLFVPGGNTAEVMRDERALRFLRERAVHARYVTSVCTGSLVLAAAGLLNGYRAATHWAARDILAMFDVEVVDERVVTDRNRVTGGGVTAGIDFGLALVAAMLDEPSAKLLQLMLEYTPAPPFDSGDPEAAGAELVAIATQQIKPLNDRIMESARAAIAAMP